ncbi:MAG: rhodanese-like domain-containing protein [Pseudomonadota bacterium]
MNTVKAISASDFVKLLEEDNSPHILDIRSQLEFDSLQLEVNVTHTPLHEIKVEEYPHKQQETYILCKMGPRAFKLAELLADLGHTHLSVIDGGILGCLESGAEIKIADPQPNSHDIQQAVQSSFQEFMLKNA